jgi:hypothetical protein
MKIFRSFRHKNPEHIKEYLESDKKIGWNLYDYRKLGEGVKRFHIIHYVFKYKVLVPILALVRKFFKKEFERPIPDRWYNQDIKIFDKAFEEAIHTWIETYIATSRAEGNITKEKLHAQHDNRDSVIALRTMKQITIQMALNDSAYREFLTCLLHMIAKHMNEAYKGQTVNHLVYNSAHTFDILYYVIGKDIRTGFALKPARPSPQHSQDDVRVFLRWAVSEALKDVLEPAPPDKKD